MNETGDVRQSLRTSRILHTIGARYAVGVLGGTLGGASAEASLAAITALFTNEFSGGFANVSRVATALSLMIVFAMWGAYRGCCIAAAVCLMAVWCTSRLRTLVAVAGGVIGFALSLMWLHATYASLVGDLEASDVEIMIRGGGGTIAGAIAAALCVRETRGN